MSNKFTILDFITEVVESDDDTDLDKLYIEITYYLDHMPQINSYYKLTNLNGCCSEEKNSFYLA